MFRRKSKSNLSYEVQSLGTLEIVRIQLPSEIDFKYSKHSIVTWDYELRFGRYGPCILRKSYISGDPQPFIKLGTTGLINYTQVDNPFESDLLFYDEVRNFLGGCNENLR